MTCWSWGAHRAKQSDAHPQGLNHNHTSRTGPSCEAQSAATSSVSAPPATCLPAPPLPVRHPLRTATSDLVPSPPASPLPVRYHPTPHPSPSHSVRHFQVFQHLPTAHQSGCTENCAWETTLGRPLCAGCAAEPWCLRHWQRCCLHRWRPVPCHWVLHVKAWRHCVVCCDWCAVGVPVDGRTGLCRDARLSC